MDPETPRVAYIFQYFWTGIESSGTEASVSPGVREPQGNGEPGSGITEPQPGTVQVSYCFYETQSQAIALGMARTLETDETLQHMLPFRRRYARTGITHHHLDGVFQPLTRSSIAPPSGVYLIALSSRLPMACASRSRLPVISAGSPVTSLNSCPFYPATGL